MQAILFRWGARFGRRVQPCSTQPPYLFDSVLGEVENHGETRPERRSANRESGFSLVEVIVATMLMGIGIAGAASVLASSSRTAATASHRSQASHLAVAEIETIRAMSYDLVAIDPEAKGFEKEFDGRETVTSDELGEPATKKPAILSPIGTAPRSDIVMPYEEVKIADMTFTVFRHVTWAAAGPDTQTIKRSYKVINIIIRWTDSSGQHEVQQETGLFSGFGS